MALQIIHEAWRMLWDYLVGCTPNPSLDKNSCLLSIVSPACFLSCPADCHRILTHRPTPAPLNAKITTPQDYTVVNWTILLRVHVPHSCIVLPYKVYQLHWEMEEWRKLGTLKKPFTLYITHIVYLHQCFRDLHVCI